jgi:hypothetical protein
MSEPVFDKQDQFDKVAAGLLDGERIVAVYDAIGARTGFLAITNYRVVLQDNSFVGKKVALTSLPFARINAVSLVSDKSILGQFASAGTLAVTVGSETYEVDFRGDEKARYAHDAILWHMVHAR